MDQKLKGITIFTILWQGQAINHSLWIRVWVWILYFRFRANLTWPRQRAKERERERERFTTHPWNIHFQYGNWWIHWIV